MSPEQATRIAASAGDCVRDAATLLKRPTPEALERLTGQLENACSLVQALQTGIASGTVPSESTLAGLHGIRPGLARIRVLLHQALDHRMACGSLAGALGYSSDGALAVTAAKPQRLQLEV